MRMVEHRIRGLHPLADTYEDDYKQLSHFFHYDPRDERSSRLRSQWLDQTSPMRADRVNLAQVLEDYNRSIGAGEKALQHIAELKKEDTVCVVGGQQAGLLTGPMYTIYKAISLIHWAQHERSKGSRSVIPVFWIAGEDHDWEEVDHVYVSDRHGQPAKLKLSSSPHYRASISHWDVTGDHLKDFVDTIVQYLPDSACKQELTGKIKEMAALSSTLSSFFARLMAWLFEEEGLVLVDSADPALRKLEAPFFYQLIESNEELHHCVKRQKQELERLGFPAQVELHPDDAHLFIYERGERLLLQRDGVGFATKVGGYRYSRSELLRIAETRPEKLSTNVFFRTLMQEYLFPTVHTILGSGELAYWALFGRAFEHLEFRMPLIQPRFGATIIDPYEEKWMKGYGVQFEDVRKGLENFKEQLLINQGRDKWQQQFEQTKEAFLRLYEPMVTKVIEHDAGLSGLASSNIERIIEQISFLEESTQRSLIKRNETDLERLNRIQEALWPQGKPQERIYPVFLYICRYGLDWWRQMKNYPWNLTTPHHLIFLSNP
jgi:bacillithiol biosynthesis cysteine-adding enzyme BshC